MHLKGKPKAVTWGSIEIRSMEVQPSSTRKGSVVSVEEVEDEHFTSKPLDSEWPYGEAILVEQEHENKINLEEPPTPMGDPQGKKERKPRKVRVRTGKSEKKDTRLPHLGKASNPSLHSSSLPRRDRFGDLDPLGVNESIWKSTKATAERLATMGSRPEAEIPRLRQQWIDRCQDIMQGAPAELPPFREINHRIPLIDPEKVYNYHLPRCPEAVKVALSAKIERYETAGWWKRAVVTQAAPMLCVPKKNGDLRTVVDCRKRNDNTLRDVTPFPDQEEIRADVARSKYRSKIDLSDAYEQIRIESEDVPKTAFATVYGTFVSNVMQQGDCNAPSTFQRLMTYVFRDFIGRFVHVYLDDIFVYSNTIEEHEEHLRLVFERLRDHKLYLKASKCDLYSERMECLGHIIDDEGIHADEDKMTRIREWRTPRNYNDIERFLGLVNYVAHFMPDVSAFTGPLHTIQRNGHSFEWRPIHQACFDNIKALAAKAPILKPIDPKSEDPIWVVCDASTHGVGAYYGQGKDWKTCRPAGFMSKKFTTAQQSYRVFELETLAILEALLKWEDKLLGHKVCIVTDHKALEFFKSQTRMSHRQTRWMEFLQRFDFEITYVKGEENIVADCLSRYHESDLPHEFHPLHFYVNADERLDPEGESLPIGRTQELRAIREDLTARELREEKEDRVEEAAELRGQAPIPSIQEQIENAKGPSWIESMTKGEPIHRVMNGELDLRSESIKGYLQDKVLSKVVKEPERFTSFKKAEDGALFVKNLMGNFVLCIPHCKVGRRYLTELVIEQAHRTVGHMASQKTEEYVRQWVWWPRIGMEIRRYCESCGVCQTTKANTALPRGLLHSLPIPSRPFGSLGMDFVGPFPPSNGYDYLWVIICRLTSMVHLIPIRTTTKASELAWLFVREVVRLHGLPDSIVSDRDSKFTSHFWKDVHRILGVKLLMSTAFHPQTDGASERAIKTVAQVLRSVVSADQKDWVAKLPMTEFALNSAKSSSTGFAPFDLNGATPRISFTLDNVDGAPGVAAFAQQVQNNLLMAHDAILENRVYQTDYANQRRRSEHPGKEGETTQYRVGSLVYLSTKNLKLPKGRARKLLPKFLGPYKIAKAHPEASAYQLELPDELKARGIFPKFHASLLRPYTPNDDSLFPHRDPKAFYDYGMPDETEWLVDDIISHQWDGPRIFFLVKWNLGDSTWEPLEGCDELEALDRYLDTMGVTRWEDLPRRDTEIVPPAQKPTKKLVERKKPPPKEVAEPLRTSSGRIVRPRRRDDE